MGAGLDVGKKCRNWSEVVSGFSKKGVTFCGKAFDVLNGG